MVANGSCGGVGLKIVACAAVGGQSSTGRTPVFISFMSICNHVIGLLPGVPSPSVGTGVTCKNLKA